MAIINDGNGDNDDVLYTIKTAEMGWAYFAEVRAKTLGFHVGTDFKTMKPIYWVPGSEEVYRNIGDRQRE